MNSIETLLLNILFIIIFLLFVPLFLERYSKSFSFTQKKWVLTISASIAIVSCMSFPVHILDGFIFDLRWIPVIVVGLYGGLPASVFLVSITIVYRFFLGGGGIYSTIIIGVIVLFYLFLVTKPFVKSSLKKKLMIGSCFSFSVGVFVLIVLNIIAGISINFSLILLYLFLTPFTSCLIIYILEVIKETIFFNSKLIKAEKMEIVSHLASSISHEIRNPLAVVRGFLQMMEQMDLSAQKNKEFLDISIAEIDRANDIIRNYLTFAKPSPENIEIIDIKQELERALNIITPLANMNCVEIDANLEQSYYIIGEAQLLQQCLLNIVKNCLEAMPEGGQLQISTSKLSQEIMITITDNGQGMTKDQLSRLGEPYFTTKGREGTGLGMMTAIQIIKMMDGRLNVKSTVNKGTTFQITLPLQEVALNEVAATNN
ncbi:two-component sensor histidine kinase [Anaerobacillus alkaliphilus]|uniref:histidine kinase n=1 Tax=Anaerobacillus alkaliphilus TaxID=1548597 RepID=A0A4Q0VQU5_9BACI|nr:sensor histidine kinase [Anaerobacillus alkaliphilus]RXI98618.1 two-component sensor histidine kinase [Anaerobacillus alkaliphilus]